MPILRTNSLIFYVTPTQFSIIKKLLAKLDSPGRQVYVSAVVAEMDVTKVRNFNINTQIAGSVVAADNGVVDAASLLQLVASGGFVIGGISGQTTTFTANGVSTTIPNAFALFSFLFQDTFFHTLASPRVLTQDNQEADISVSTIVPFATGVGFNINGQPIINFDYREVGLALKVTPHISQANKVRLELDEGLQEIQSFQTEGCRATQFQVPIVSKRQVNTTVTRRRRPDHRHRRSCQQDDHGRHPAHSALLSDIPLIGELFKQKNRNDQKTTLMIFLTPHIIDTPNKLADADGKVSQAAFEAGQPCMRAEQDIEQHKYGSRAPKRKKGDDDDGGMFPGFATHPGPIHGLRRARQPVQCGRAMACHPTVPASPSIPTTPAPRPVFAQHLPPATSPRRLPPPPPDRFNRPSRRHRPTGVPGPRRRVSQRPPVVQLG